MTWNELASEIARLPANVREQRVAYLEHYDAPSLFRDLTIIVAEEAVHADNGETLHGGEACLTPA